MFGQLKTTVFVELIFIGIILLIVFHFALKNAVIGKVEGEQAVFQYNMVELDPVVSFLNRVLMTTSLSENPISVEYLA